MANILFELDRLRVNLENKGLDYSTIETIIQKATSEIRDAFQYHGEAAMQLAIEEGVAKRSPEFINELKLDIVNLRLTTDSGNMEFSTPPYPNLQNLLQGAKPMRDGSGVYKVIPVGKPGSNRPRVSANIYDAMKQANAERAENARAQYSAVAPKGSPGKQQFRTATSKQSSATKWVMPAQEKDFSGDMKNINNELSGSMDEVIKDIIRSYEEGF